MFCFLLLLTIWFARGLPIGKRRKNRNYLPSEAIIQDLAPQPSGDILHWLSNRCNSCNFLPQKAYYLLGNLGLYSRNFIFALFKSFIEGTTIRFYAKNIPGLNLLPSSRPYQGDALLPLKWYVLAQHDHSRLNLHLEDFKRTFYEEATLEGPTMGSARRTGHVMVPYPIYTSPNILLE